MRRRETLKLAAPALGILGLRMSLMTQRPEKKSVAPGFTARAASLLGDTLQVSTADQGALSISLTPNTRIFGSSRHRSLEDIRPGQFVGSAAVRGRDGKLHAQEVHIFPEALRGTGEGHRPFDEPEQTMTNATLRRCR